MSTPIVYRSSDTGATTLTVAMPQPDASSVGAVLKSCLVTGYGAKSAAGWTNPYSDGSGKYVFQQGGGSQEYLYLYDGHPSYGGQTVNLKGFETMSALETGTNPYPNSAIGTFTSTFVKPTGALAWTLVADDRTFSFYVRQFSASLYYQLWYGDFFSQVTGGLYRTFLQCYSPLTRHTYITSTASPAGAWTPRLYDGTYNSANQQLTIYSDTAKTGNYTNIFVGDLPYPNSGDNKIWLARVELGQPDVPTPRGYLRGFWHWLHQTASVANDDVWPGTDDLVGRNFLLIRDIESGGSTKHVMIHETTAWDTN